jgi:thiamine-monophosphate kinase
LARGVSVGIGDDAAVVRLRAAEELVVSVDATVEDVHFDWKIDDPNAVGRRSIAAALSDLAAMGARPVGCMLSLAAPPALELRRLDAVLRGIVAEAGRRDCPLVGGNVARAAETSFHLTVLGAVQRGRALRRTGARAGDVLLVTGELGRSALARARAEAEGRPNRYVPPDRLAAGRTLAALGLRTACIDLSDGLAADLPHLLGAKLGAQVDVAALPRARGFDARCRRLGLEPEALLVGGGEDYELLFSQPPGAERERLSRRLGAPIHIIGRVLGEPGIRGLGDAGWRHF